MATAGSTGSKGENISHYTAVRMRVVGNGKLRLKMVSDDGVVEQELLPMDLLERTNIQPTRLCNFTQQRAQLEIKTTHKDEIFRINRIIIYAKEIFSSYPG